MWNFKWSPTFSNLKWLGREEGRKEEISKQGNLRSQDLRSSKKDAELKSDKRGWFATTALELQDATLSWVPALPTRAVPILIFEKPGRWETEIFLDIFEIPKAWEFRICSPISTKSICLWLRNLHSKYSSWLKEKVQTKLLATCEIRWNPKIGAKVISRT